MPGEINAKQVEAVRTQRETLENELNSLVDGIKKARDEVDGALGRLNTLSSELRVKARRASDNGYMMFASAHLRLAAALSQGVKRTASTDRILYRAKLEREAEGRREELEKRLQERREAKKNAKTKVDALIQPTEDAFEELYGGMINGE